MTQNQTGKTIKTPTYRRCQEILKGSGTTTATTKRFSSHVFAVLQICNLRIF